MPSISTEELLAKLKGLPQFHIPNMIPAETASNAGAAVADMGEKLAAPRADVPQDSGDTQALVQQLKGLLNPPPPTAGQAALGAMAQFSRAGFQDPGKAQELENQRTALNQQNMANRARMVMEQLQNQRQQDFQQGEIARQNRALDIEQQNAKFNQNLASQKFPYELSQLKAATTKEEGEAAKSGLITVGDNVYRVQDLLNGEHPEALQPIGGNMVTVSPTLAQSIGQPQWAGKNVSLKVFKDATETASAARKTNTTGEGVIEENLITGEKTNIGSNPTIASATNPAAIAGRAQVQILANEARNPVPNLDYIKEQTNSGRNYIDASKVNPNTLDRLQNEAGQAGIKVVDKDIAAGLREADTVRNMQQSMLDMLNGKLANNPSSRLFVAPENRLKAIGQIDPQLASMKSFIGPAISSLRALAGNKNFRITQPEVDAAIAAMPTASDTVETAKTKIQTIAKFLDDKERAVLGDNGQGGATNRTRIKF